MSEIPSDEGLQDERMIFLKELASNPDRDAYELCDTLSLPQFKVMSFLRSYFKTVAQHTDSDDRLSSESYKKIRDDISLGVRTEFGELTDRDVDNLYYVYEKYRTKDPSLYFEVDQIRAIKMQNPNSRAAAPPTAQQVAHDSSRIPDLNPTFTPPQSEPNQQKDTNYYNKPSRPQTINDPSQTDFNVDRLNKGYSYEFLYSLTRVGLLRFVLEGLPYPPSGSKIEGFIQFFELNQDELMASPDALRDRLMRYFGDKTGEQASVAVNSYIRYLRPEFKFGVQKLGGQLRDGYFLGNDPLYGRQGVGGGGYTGGPIPFQQNPDTGIWGTGAIPMQQQQGGPRWQDPYNTYYHAELVLPYGMDARSEDAKRLIHEWEAKKKRKKEMDESQAEIMQKINQQMAFSMTDILNRGKQTPNGGSILGPEFLQSMIAMSLMGMVTSGKANIMPYTDENGKIQIKMEQVPQLDHTPAPDPNAIGAKDILTLIGGLYEKIADKSTEAMQARIDGLKDAIGLGGEKKDPIASVGEMMQGLRQIVPGLEQQFSGGGINNLDMAKIALERDKFNYDRERSDTLIDHQFEIKKMEKEHEQESEIEAAKTRQHTIDGITKALKSALPSVIQLLIMFMSMRNPNLAPLAGGLGGMGGGGGGLGDILGNVFKMFSGGKGGGDNEDEDEEEGGGNPFASILGGLGGSSSDNEDEEEEGGGFNLGDLVSNVMPGVMNALNQTQAAQRQAQRPPTRFPMGQDPEIHSGYGHHQNRMRTYDQGDGVRPTFMDVEVGNTNAATLTPMTQPGESADNIYENIQSEHTVITNQPNVHPELVSDELSVSRVITPPTRPEDEDPNVIKLPRYQDKLLNQAAKPEPGVVIPSPRQQQTVNTYQEELTDEPPGDDDEAYPIYEPEDFDDLPDNEIKAATNEAAEAVRSADSYMRSINEQRKRRARKH